MAFLPTTALTAKIAPGCGQLLGSQPFSSQQNVTQTITRGDHIVGVSFTKSIESPPMQAVKRGEGLSGKGGREGRQQEGEEGTEKEGRNETS